MLVFHLNQERYPGTWREFRVMASRAAFAQKCWNEGAYNLVAHVQTTDTEKAFRLTNHIDADWKTNHGVSPASGPQRSTSVGDLIVDNNGVAWLVCGIGFEALPDIKL